MKTATKLEKEWKEEVGDTSNNPNAIDWSAADERLKGEQPPPGTFSMPDVMAKYGISKDKAGRLIRALVSDGKAASIGVFLQRKFYRMVKK